MQHKWYRHFNIIAGILVFIGGIGLNVRNELPVQFHITILAIGLVVFAVFLVKKTQERPEDNSN